MIPPDDPRLTAYADGVLSPEETARLERELAADPAACAEVERLRALQRSLREAFAEETAEAGVFSAAEEAAAVGELEPQAPARRRPYSIYRDAMNAREEAEGWRPLTPAEDRASRGHPLAWLFPGWLAPVAAAVCVALLLAAIVVPQWLRGRELASRSTPRYDLRQIGQASMVFASDNADKLPVATDVWDYARQLAIEGGLTDANVWRIGVDPGVQGATITTVLAADRESLDPAFAKLKPSIAVVLSGLDTVKDPMTTPIAWTRGLQPDGTWAAHSPFGKRGGYIVFLGGNVQFSEDLRGANQLLRHDGKCKTSDIREALPPDARIGEYIPTATEQAEWAKAYRDHADNSLVTKLRHSKQSMAFVGLAWVFGVGSVVVFMIRRRTA